MINNVVLSGRLTDNIDLRYTGNGVPVTNFNLAVERSYVKEGEERESDFVQCVIWRKSAEAMNSMLAKGSLIGVEGSIQTSNYDNDSGQRVYVTEVLVDKFHILETKETNEKRRQAQGLSIGGGMGGNQPNNMYNDNQSVVSGQNQANQPISQNQGNQPVNQGQGNQPVANNQSKSQQWSNQNSEHIEVKNEDLPF